MKKFFFIFLLVAVLPFRMHGQVDVQLAAQYYATGEYDKAVVYYEKLYDKQPVAVYYNYYLNCLIYTQDFKKAEKLVKKNAARNPGSLTWHIDLGRVYQASLDTAKATKEFDAAISSIDASVSKTAVIELANAFLGINDPDRAVSTFLQGRKALGTVYSFSYELADVYYIQKNYAAVAKEYMDQLAVSDGYMNDIKVRLQTKMDADLSGQLSEELKKELIRRAQKEPDKETWSSMLVWYYMSQKDFASALIHDKAIDKRLKKSGSDIMNLALTARANEDYATAIDAYTYVISLGKDGAYYKLATIEKLKTQFTQVTVSGKYTQQEVLSLQADMNASLNELGKNVYTVDLMRTLAHVDAFYLFDTKSADTLLEQALTVSGISPKQTAECKLELGDVLVLEGSVWEASLRYSQVEKAFKFEDIGEEAKYRNAKIAFYIGDFKWAQVQLEVLKSATSKLISNDAMYMSILITENLALDSNPDPLLKFARADLDIFQNNYVNAKLELDSIDKIYPNHSLEDDVLMKRYQMAYKQQDWTAAADYLQSIINAYSQDILGDDATYLLAQLYETKLLDKDKAKKYYSDVFTNYPSSTYATDARKKFRELRGDNIAQ